MAPIARLGRLELQRIEWPIGSHKPAATERGRILAGLRLDENEYLLLVKLQWATTPAEALSRWLVAIHALDYMTPIRQASQSARDTVVDVLKHGSAIIGAFEDFARGCLMEVIEGL